MCERRTRKIKRGSQVARLREARRLERLQRLSAPIVPEETVPSCPPTQMIDKTAQNRVILELAWRTVALMNKNKLIQQKIIALQKETSDFIASVMSNPENRRRYVEHVRLYGIPQQLELHIQNNSNTPLKVESNA